MQNRPLRCWFPFTSLTQFFAKNLKNFLIDRNKNHVYNRYCEYKPNIENGYKQNITNFLKNAFCLYALIGFLKTADLLVLD